MCHLVPCGIRVLSISGVREEIRKIEILGIFMTDSSGLNPA